MTDMGSAMFKTFLVVIMLAGLLSSSRAATYTVGGSTGWTLGPPVTPSFYDDWVAGIDLVAGDVLVFPYPSNTHNVFEVTKADLTTCTIDNPITTYDTLGGASVTLTTGYHAYICGIPGHCAAFMKMNVQVGTSAPAIAPVAAPTVAPPATNGTIPRTPPTVNATSPTAPPAPAVNATPPTTSAAPVPATLTPPAAPPTAVPSAATPATPPVLPTGTPLLSPPSPIAPIPTTTPTAPSPESLASAPGPNPGENGASLVRSTSMTIVGIVLCALPALIFH